jgi:hypothetical protein
LLIAVDDIMMPYYADTFQLDANGTPTHDESWSLPALVNGHYFLAETTDNNDLLLASSYHHRGGAGQQLTRKPMVDMSSKLREQHTNLDSDVPTRVSFWFYEPYTTYYTDERPTRWKAIAVLKKDGKDDTILLACGQRGLMSIPVLFERDVVPSMDASFGGAVCGVRTFDDEAWLLISSSEELGSARLVKVGSKDAVSLPGRFDGLL